MAASDAYDVLVLVHDFPYKSMPAEVATANDVTVELLAATRDRPHLAGLRVVDVRGAAAETRPCWTSRAMARRCSGALEAFTAIASVAHWEGARARRLDRGPWRRDWPALAADRTAYGLGPTATIEAPAPAAASDTVALVQALSEADSLELLSGRHRVTTAIAASDASAAVAAARSFGTGPIALKIDAADVPHKSELGLVRLGLAGDDVVRAAAEALLAGARSHGVDARGLLVQPMADPGVELIVGLRRDASFGPAVVVGLGGLLTEVLDDVAIRLAPVDRDTALAMLAELRGASSTASAAPPRPTGTRSRPSSWRSRGSAMHAPTSSRSTSTRSSPRRPPRWPSTRWSCWPRGRRSTMPDERVVLTTRTPWGVRLILNRPAKLNALNGAMVHALWRSSMPPRPTQTSASSSSRAPVGPSPPATT